MTIEKKANAQTLDALFKARYHGAINIRGIRFQILYSVLRAFDLYGEGRETSAMQLEGIEDFDLLGLRLGNEYIQVKSSDDPWNWSKLKDPVKSFLEVLRVSPNCRFLLAVDFPLRKDIARLAQVGSIPPDQKQPIKDKFRNLCREVGGSQDEAYKLLGRLSVVFDKLKQDVPQLT